jgi:hypothetical protein
MWATDDDAQELEELYEDIRHLRRLVRAGRADKGDKALLAQYLADRRELQARLEQGECS